MAKIESRRLKRRLLRLALPIGAALVVCAILAAVLLLPKTCSSDKNSKDADNTPVPVTTETVTEAVSPSPKEAVQPTEAEATPGQTEAHSTLAPAQTTAPEDTDTASPVPAQSSEDRSLELVSLSLDPLTGGISGSCAVSFINNTDSVMYAAYFDIGAFAASLATVNAEPARFSFDTPGVLIVPFANELAPGGETEIYFEFACAASLSFTIPCPAYDTAYDAVCFVSSYKTLGFSAGETSLEIQGGTYVYRLTAQRASSAILVSFE